MNFNLSEKIAQLAKQISHQVEHWKLSLHNPVQWIEPEQFYLFPPEPVQTEDQKSESLFRKPTVLKTTQPTAFEPVHTSSPKRLNKKTKHVHVHSTQSASHVFFPPTNTPQDITQLSEVQKTHWEHLTEKTPLDEIDQAAYNPMKQPLIHNGKFFLPFNDASNSAFTFISRFQIWSNSNVESESAFLHPLKVPPEDSSVSHSHDICLCAHCLSFDQKIMKQLNKKKEQISWIPESQLALVPFLQTGDMKRSCALFSLLGFQLCPYCFYCSLPENKIKTKKKHQKQFYKKKRKIFALEDSEESELGSGSEQHSPEFPLKFSCQQCEKDVDVRSLWNFAKKCIEQMLSFQERIHQKIHQKLKESF